MPARFVTEYRASDIKPGDLVSVDAGGTRVAIANVDGRLYAFDDTCTHAECALSDGVLEGTVVTCLCHGAEFDVTDGRVLAPPADTPVAAYPLRVDGDQIVIEV